jgi:hypothetical protein
MSTDKIGRLYKTSRGAPGPRRANFYMGPQTRAARPYHLENYGNKLPQQEALERKTARAARAAKKGKGGTRRRHRKHRHTRRR